MLQYVAYFLLFIALLYLSLYITGRDRRAYAVLPPDATVTVNQTTLRLSQLASKYQPKMYLSPSTPSPALLWTWYEPISSDDEIIITYYQNWENEINPNAIIHRLYWLFRAAYYGYPTYDIEFFQVTISKATGDVIGMLFETSPGNDYYVTISEHLIARYTRLDDASYQRTLTSKDNSAVLRKSVETVHFDEKHPLVLAQTWNHLSTLVSDPKANLILLESDLRYLTDRDYSSLKFVRKSQGDYKTKENKVSSVVAAIGIYILVTIPAAILSSRSRKKEKNAS